VAEKTAWLRARNFFEQFDYVNQMDIIGMFAQPVAST